MESHGIWKAQKSANPAYFLPLGDFVKITILGILVLLLFPISIESIVIWTELKHKLSIHSEILFKQ